MEMIKLIDKSKIVKANHALWRENPLLAPLGWEDNTRGEKPPGKKKAKPKPPKKKVKIAMAKIDAKIEADKEAELLAAEKFVPEDPLNDLLLVADAGLIKEIPLTKEEKIALKKAEIAALEENE